MTAILDRGSKIEVLTRVGDATTKTSAQLDAIACDYGMTLKELAGLVEANERAVAAGRVAPVTGQAPANQPSLESRPAAVGKKVCKSCRQTRALDDFRPAADHTDGRRNKCRDCDNRGLANVRRMLHNRARHRATAALVEAHKDEFTRLFETAVHDVETEHEQIAAAAAARGHAVALPAGRTAQARQEARRADLGARAPGRGPLPEVPPVPRRRPPGGHRCRLHRRDHRRPGERVMTEQPAETAPETAPPSPVQAPAAQTVVPRKGTRLDQLHAVYLDLHAKKDEIEKQFKAAADAIKVELNTLDPEQRRFELQGRDGRRPLTLRYSESSRFDSTRFKREHPEAYVSYLKPPSGSWTLQPAKDGGSE